ncbi:MAG: MOSC domain-containing protein [Hamadaea sp.]|uniref:MOSC domain-containing protein n=1 Tax=Hamadaea sp. TaxID=2024425 RepID=UPI0017E863D4|nr:MOSC N-terminal beta barrel domain-containing protein [Hamadaea sp.]NUR71428.1 MOSC domain-containing protein [Hamadaea sp.]NUT23738.1 MOSC domain-containing protein [Hamadaea sp.]
MVGTVAELRRHPVKSMLGEQVSAAEVTERGLAGDRRWAVVDRETGKIASAKTPRLWRALLTCRATAGLEGPVIVGPDGDLMDSDELTKLLGRPVRLASTPPPGASLDRSKPDQVLDRGLDAEVDADVVHFGSAAPAGTFFDFAPIHLITTSTLRSIAALSPRTTVEVERYRPNLVVDTAEPGFPEHAWVGGNLRIGDQVVLRIIASTPRCAIPTLGHGELARDAYALRVLAEHNRVPALPGRGPEPCAGVYAQVVAPGLVRPGDQVAVA